MMKRSAGDHRLILTLLGTAFGAIIVIATCVVRQETLSDFIGVGCYSVGWALLTFGILYLLSRWFESMEWRRPDHDLVAKFEEAVED